jgi:hypothetical protein
MKMGMKNTAKAMKVKAKKPGNKPMKATKMKPKTGMKKGY